MAVHRSLKDYSKKTGDQLKKLTHENIFEEGGLSELITQIDNIGRRKDGKLEVIIPRNKPLVIKQLNHEIITNIEITCTIKGEINDNNNIDFSEYSVEINLWSDNPDYCYREDLDSEIIGEHVKSGIESGMNFKRILLRFHFDMRAKTTVLPEPLFHFHLGGKIVDKSCYMWIPTGLVEPRIPYPPMDPFLLIDLILRNFCLRLSYNVIEDLKWKSEVRNCHNLFQRQYEHSLLHESLFSD